MITLSIDVTKIDKTLLKEGKSGQKYLDLVLHERDDSYGNNFMVVQSLPKERRDAGEKGKILGNGKDWSKGKGGKSQAAHAAKAAAPEPDDSDIPF